MTTHIRVDADVHLGLTFPKTSALSGVSSTWCKSVLQHHGENLSRMIIHIRWLRRLSSLQTTVTRETTLYRSLRACVSHQSVKGGNDMETSQCCSTIFRNWLTFGIAVDFSRLPNLLFLKSFIFNKLPTP